MENNLPNSGKWSALFNAAIFTAAATALIYVLGIQYQLSYYGYFGINPIVAGINLDTLTLTNGSFSMLFPIVCALVTWLVLWAMVKYREIHPARYRFLVELLFVIMMVIIAVNGARQLDDEVSINLIGSWFAVGVLSFYIALSVYSQKVVMKHEKVGFVEAYRFRSQFITTPQIAHKIYEISPPTLIMLMVILLTPFAYTLTINTAKRSATNQNKFTVLINENKNIKTVVIARSPDGLITKKFNTKNKQFEASYSVKKYDEVSFLVEKLR